MTTNNKYPYQIYRTKECLKEGKECPENTKIFNYICYENGCPLNTKEYTDKECICDESLGYWYKFKDEKSQRYYYKCGLKNCEGDFKNLYRPNNECVINCGDKKVGENSMVSFRGICYEECPDFTKKIDNIFECGFYKLEEANSLEQLRNYTNIQVRELYENSNAGGYLFNNTDMFLQIYGIDKENSNKNLIMKSSLSYIDLDSCKEKIYHDNKFSDKDKILVIKYDMRTFKTFENKDESNDLINNKQKNNYLINPVEYEFFSSITGEKIDGSICEPNEIIISYPISYTINKYDEFSDGINKNEILKKFEVGKELSHKNKNIDVFNFNNSIYKDICINAEINGKDLVLEDRFDVLYPNNVTLCENNCFLYYTDYELGRINCKCNYKNNLEFHRIYPESSDLLNDPNFKNPTQSDSNFEVIKCLSKFPGKDSIIKNEAFYYCAFITVVEISLIFVGAFHGIKTATSNIANLIKKPNMKMNNTNENQISSKNEHYISTSKRLLVNPPKRNKNDIINEDGKEDDKTSEKLRNIINNKEIEIINLNNNKSDDINKNNKNYFGVQVKNAGISSNIKNNGINENINIDINGKAEFMPIEFNFKYFKSSDKGVIKKIERNKIPFKMNTSTKYLLERKPDINYDKNYLYGPFLSTQNIIEIIDNEKDLKYKKDENIKDKNINKKNNDNQNTNIKERKINNLILENEKDFISIKKISPTKKRDEVNFIVEDYKEEREKEKLDDNLSLYTLIQKEQKLLRVTYKKYLEKDHSNLLSIFMAEIMDKIYLLKICCFLRNFEIFSVHLILYLIFHLMLLTLLCSFFTIKTIKKIWNQENFPQFNFYLLYGFLANVVVWVIYKIFICLLNVQDSVRELIKLKNELKNNENKLETKNEDDLNEKEGEITEELIYKKYDELAKR